MLRVEAAARIEAAKVQRIVTNAGAEQASEARLQLVLESATDYGIITTDLGGIVTSWNRGAERILGWAKADIVGKEAALFFTPEDRTANVPAEEMRIALEQGRAADERWHVKCSGERFWADGTMMPLREADGTAVGYLKILRDQTREHEAGQALRLSQAALAESEARCRALADNMPQLAWIADADGSIVWYNRRWHEYCGTTPEQMLGSSWQAVHDPEILPDVLARWRVSIATGAPFEMTFPLRGGDGVFHPFLTRVEPVRDEQGRVTRWFGTSTDVTESRVAEVANARLAAIVASTEDAIVSYAPDDGCILSWNKGAERLFGYTEAEMLGSLATRLRPPDLPEDEQVGIVAWVLAGRAVMGHETTRLTKSGKRIPVSVTAAHMLASDGHIIGVSAIFHDLRPRLRAEAQLRESQEALRNAQKLEAIGRLAAGVAHDFNNILQGVMGSLELVLDEVETGSTAREMAELALNSARRGAGLTHHLLAYARKQMLQPKRVAVAPFLAEMQRLLTRTLGPHVAVEVRADQAAPSIEVDPGQLHTALLNLALNAAHAMPGGGTLSLNAREIIEADQRWVVVAVTDNGAGMDEVTLAKACEPFFTTKGLDGTGLGLSMVQGFAEQSGGHVRIASAPGQGTTVMLWLPVSDRLSSSSGELQVNPAALRGSGRILLVDDLAEVLATVGASLERAGFEVVRASGGEQALAALVADGCGERFDALVTDYAMPGLNGVGLIEQARALRPGLPALLITGFIPAGSGSGTLPEGVVVLGKPFQRDELIEAVLGTMERGTPAQEKLERDHSMSARRR